MPGCVKPSCLAAAVAEPVLMMALKASKLFKLMFGSSVLMV
jgi:hypothetical protein